MTLAGIVVALTGVALAILFGKRGNDTHHGRRSKARWQSASPFGLFSGLCQAIGSIIIRPVMAAGVDPFAIAAIRVGIAALGLTLAMFAGVSSARAKTALTPKLVGQVALSGFAPWASA